MEKSIIQRLIDAGICTHKDVEQYIDEYNKKNEKQKRLIEQKLELITQDEENQTKTYSKIENSVFKKFDERDLDKNGSYIVPANVTKIGRFAFSGCKKINSVQLGPNVKTVDKEAFFNSGLKYIDLAYVESIGEGAFSFCLDLEGVKLSSKLRIIDRGVFYNCMNLKQFITPACNVITLVGSEWANRSDAYEELISYMRSNKELAR
ncbi:MAG: leucine-rich repeat domain-containing protein [Clostridia bacterium]|nr:leucine-rich repeat domain-containing protein [Clostridia bacterium]